jgi:hypothetical protein
MALLVATALSAPAAVASASPGHVPHRPAVGSGGWFVVADPAADAVYVLDARTGRRTGALRGVELGSHAGVVQLGNGRIGLVDEAARTFDVVRIGSAGRPHVVQRHRIPALAGPWNRAGWISTDPTHRYVAIGSDVDDSTSQQVSLVDLTRRRMRTAVLTTHEVTLATTGERGTEEMETFLVGDPLRLVVSAGGRLDEYDAHAILRGRRSPRVVRSTPLGAYPHGPVVASDGSAIGTTLHGSVQTLRVRGERLRGRIDRPYRAGTVQAYRPRMAPDGTTFASTQAAASSATFLVSGSVTNGRLRTIALGAGTASRVALTAREAVATVSSATTTRLVEVAARRSGLFAGRVSSIRIAPLASGSTAARAVGVSADGRRAVVTRNGEGSVDLVDLRHDRVLRTVALPSSLADGGYVTAVDPKEVPADLIGR